MTQAKLIQYALVGVPLGLMLIGAAAVTWTVASPKGKMLGEAEEGERVSLREDISEAELRRSLEVLTVKIGPRPASDALATRRTAKWIAGELGPLNTGYERVEEQAFEAAGEVFKNLAVELPGKSKPEEIVVVGAHYDTVPDCPGADDNGTGVVALLALAKAFVDTEHARTLRFVAFANEEPPHFQTPTMGSLVYAKGCKERGEDIVAMVSLESLGYFSDAPGSQAYPPGVRRFYPDVGNFVGVVGNVRSRRLVDQFADAFGAATALPVEKASLPAALPGIGWSDHWSFWECGYPALMVTDTATFRNPHYHTAGDTLETIDFPRFTEAVRGIAAAVAEICDR